MTIQLRACLLIITTKNIRNVWERQEIDGIFDLVPVDGDLKKLQRINEAKNREGELQESEFLEIIKKGLLFSKQPCNISTEFPLHLTIELVELSKAMPLCTDPKITCIVIDVENIIAAISSISENINEM